MRDAASRCSTHCTPTPAPLLSWYWPRRSCCCAVFLRRTLLCHRGGWIKSAANSLRNLACKKLGIVGYGSIGTQLSVPGRRPGHAGVLHDTLTKLPLGNATQVSSFLTELLGMSDIVTLHVPETAETQWMIGEKEIRAIKKGGILINAARGTVVELTPWPTRS